MQNYQIIIIFLRKQQNIEKLKKTITKCKSTHKKYRNYLIKLNSIVHILKVECSQVNSLNKSQKEEILNIQDFDINYLSDAEICEYTFYSLAKIRKLIQKLVFENEKKRTIPNEISQKLSKSVNPKNSIMIEDLLSDILNHTKYKSWNLKDLEFALLIKYCNSAAYFRLFTTGCSI